MGPLFLGARINLEQERIHQKTLVFHFLSCSGAEAVLLHRLNLLPLALSGRDALPERFHFEIPCRDPSVPLEEEALSSLVHHHHRSRRMLFFRQRWKSPIVWTQQDFLGKGERQHFCKHSSHWTSRVAIIIVFQFCSLWFLCELGREMSGDRLKSLCLKKSFNLLKFKLNKSPAVTKVFWTILYKCYSSFETSTIKSCVKNPPFQGYELFL